MDPAIFRSRLTEMKEQVFSKRNSRGSDQQVPLSDGGIKRFADEG
jgi:hypothetical protein